MRLSHISKRFGTNVAVDDVSIAFAPGEIIGLVGENGAGKTTLMAIAAGELSADGGTIEEPLAAGVVHQHFLLVSEFTIAENLALSLWGRPAEDIIREAGIDLRDVQRRVADLSVGEKAKLELIKAIARRPPLLILDEPTSVLAPAEAHELFDVMKRLAASGTTVVFISHKIPEVLEVATRIVVMRRGKIVVDGGTMTAEELAGLMVERREIDRVEDVAAPPDADRSAQLTLPNGLKLRRGEILAIIGVAGNGQSQLAETLRDGLGDRAAHIPEDRTRDGLVADMTICENIALAERRWNPRAAARRAAALISRFDIRAHSPHQIAGSLSGGNQQKVILARELEREREILIAAEPTRGLDIEATRYIHDELRAAAARGAAILIITSDLDEAFALGDAIHVMYRGSLSRRLTPAEAGVQAPLLMSGIGATAS